MFIKKFKALFRCIVINPKILVNIEVIWNLYDFIVKKKLIALKVVDQQYEHF